MAVQTALDIANHLPATLTAPDLTEEQFLSLSHEFPGCTLEYTSDGTVIIMPPTDPESSRRVAEVLRQLANWAHAHGSGYVTGPDGGFFLQQGSRRSPDAAWFDDRRWKDAKAQGLQFPIFAPDFVIEVRSPHDQLRILREKMEEYLAAGVQLTWLIDPQERTISVYRQGQPAPQVVREPRTVVGEGPVAGFVLNLIGILF